MTIVEEKKGLWANIHAKRKRIKAGSKERMRKPGSEGAPTDQALKDSQVKEDIQPGYAPKEITYKGYTTKNLHHSADAAKAFQTTIDRSNKGLVQDPVAILNALKATDAYMKLNDMHLEQGKAPDSAEVQEWIYAHDLAKKALEKIGEFPHHMDYWNTHKTELQFMGNDFKETGKGEFNEELSNKTIKPNDKIKVARIIADMLGIDKAESGSNAEQLVNSALRKLKSKQVNPALLDVVSKMLNLADEVGIKYDTNLKPAKLKESKDNQVVVDKKSKYNIANDILRYSDYQKLLKMNKGITETKPVKQDIVVDMDDTDARDEDDNASEIADKELEKQDATHTTAGHHLGYANDDQLRRRKVKYSTEEVEELDEDQATADYKTNKDGHKFRAHKVNFANSKSNAKPDNTPNKDEDESENKNNLKVEEPTVLLGKQIKLKDNSNKVPAKGYDPFVREESEESDEMDDDELDKMASGIDHEDDIMDIYDEDELAVIDDETGEEVKDDVKEEALNEVLSKTERIRAKVRFARSSSKRERKIKIALRTHSSNSVINNRARRLAIVLMKKRIAKKPLNKLSVGEKERIEGLLARRKKIINRLAMRLVPRIRQVEKSRLSHSKFTKGTPSTGGF